MDWEGIKRIAYGPLSLSPEQLGKLTYGQFLDMWDGWKWRHKHQRQEMALMASWLTAPHLKRPLDPNKLVEDMDENNEKKKTTPEKTANLLGEMMKESGIEGKIMGVK